MNSADFNENSVKLRTISVGLWNNSAKKFGSTCALFYRIIPRTRTEIQFGFDYLLHSGSGMIQWKYIFTE